MSDISSAVGIQKPSLYHFFTSKEEIYFKVLDVIIDEVTELFRTSVGNSVEDLERTIEEGLIQGLKVGGGIAATREVLKTANPELKKEISVRYKKMIEAMAEFLLRFGIQNPAFVAQVLVDCQQMYLIRNTCDEPQLSVKEYSRQLTKLLV